MTSLIKIEITSLAQHFSTRPIGVLSREKLLKYLADADSIEIDFEKQSLTPSFADECIGVLAFMLGLEEFKRRVKLTNFDESSRPLLRHVVLKRCSEVKL